MKIEELDTLILKDEKINFKDFLLKLYVFAKGNFLKNILITNCIIENCPQSIPIIQKFKHKGRWVELFCGFVCEKNVAITENIFRFEKSRKKKMIHESNVRRLKSDGKAL